MALHPPGMLRCHTGYERVLERPQRWGSAAITTSPFAPPTSLLTCLQPLSDERESVALQATHETVSKAAHWPACSCMVHGQTVCRKPPGPSLGGALGMQAHVGLRATAPALGTAQE